MTVRADCLRDCSFSGELQAEWLQLSPPALQTQPCQTNENKAREKIGPAVSEARLEGTGRQAHLTPAPPDLQGQGEPNSIENENFHRNLGKTIA